MTPAVRQLEACGRPHRTLVYRVEAHRGGFGSAAAEALGLDPATVFKTLVTVSGEGAAALALASAGDSIDLRALSSVLGWKKASMADPAEAERLTGYVVGGISPFGGRRTLPTVVDDLALAAPEIFVSGGRRGLEIGLAPLDLVAVLDATVAPIRRLPTR